MTKKTEKHPLPLDQYDKYEIPQEYSAFIVSFPSITVDKVDDLEYEYITQGYKIFSTDTKQAESGKFDFTLIIAKLEMVF